MVVGGGLGSGGRPAEKSVGVQIGDKGIHYFVPSFRSRGRVLC